MGFKWCLTGAQLEVHAAMGLSNWTSHVVASNILTNSAYLKF